MQSCLKTIALCGDIKEASQIEVTKENRYALRLHGMKDIRKMKLNNLCACLAHSSPFILNTTLA